MCKLLTLISKVTNCAGEAVEAGVVFNTAGGFVTLSLRPPPKDSHEDADLMNPPLAVLGESSVLCCFPLTCSFCHL